jgi:EAL domain-containing protein (putative c-di-GMP-specific phosphodiesterase class I)
VLLSQIIQLGHATHLEIVAECVKTETEYAFLPVAPSGNA